MASGVLIRPAAQATGNSAWQGGYVGKLSLEAMVERTPGASDVVSDVREDGQSWG